MYLKMIILFINLFACLYNSSSELNLMEQSEFILADGSKVAKDPEKAFIKIQMILMNYGADVIKELYETCITLSDYRDIRGAISLSKKSYEAIKKFNFCSDGITLDDAQIILNSITLKKCCCWRYCISLKNPVTGEAIEEDNFKN